MGIGEMSVISSDCNQESKGWRERGENDEHISKYLADRHMGERLAAGSAMGAEPESEVGNPVQKDADYNLNCQKWLP